MSSDVKQYYFKLTAYQTECLAEAAACIKDALDDCPPLEKLKKCGECGRKFHDDPGVELRYVLTTLIQRIKGVSEDVVKYDLEKKS